MAFDVSTAGNIKLVNLMMPIDQVTFDLNPKTFRVTKGTQSPSRPQSSGGSSGAAPSPGSAPSGYMAMYRGTRPTVIDFAALLTDDDSSSADALGDATVIGGGIKARADLLLSWCQPGGGSLLGAAVSAAASALGFRFQVSARPTLLTLQWGEPDRGFLMQGTLQRVTIDYKRFDAAGNPIRAEVTVSFQEAPNSLLSLLTNPTSGGVPGRRAHVVTQGESLPGIATATYGRPQAWREIADANGIDDPLRVRPGHRLYLPPAGEVVR